MDSSERTIVRESASAGRDSASAGRNSGESSDKSARPGGGKRLSARKRQSVAAAPLSGNGRPREVPGPFGVPLTLDSLPPADTRRWVVRRKAEVVAAVRGGLLSEAEACARYRLSPEELELWQQSLDRAGVPGLRVTRIQLYREYPVEKSERPRKPARAAVFDFGREWGG